MTMTPKLHHSILLCVLGASVVQIHAQTAAPDRFQQYDKNSDGKLSAAELRNANLFKRLDKDGDGFVTREEAATVLGMRGATEPNPKPKPVAPTAPTAPKHESVELDFTRDLAIGAADANGVMITGTECNAIVAHGGKLFVVIGQWNRDPSAGANPGPLILVKESPEAAWKVDGAFAPGGTRLASLVSVRLTTDAKGAALPEPVELLIAGGSSALAESALPLFIRNDGTGKWERSELPGGIAGTDGKVGREVRLVFAHKDSVTGVHHLFACPSHGHVWRGGYDPTVPGRIAWSPTPELEGRAGRLLAAAKWNGAAHVTVEIAPDQPRNGGLFRRVDGPQPRWEWLYEWKWSHPSSKMSIPQYGMRGLTAVLDASGGFLLGAREHPGMIDRISSANPPEVTTDLEVRRFLETQWSLAPGSYTGTTLLAYNDMPLITPPGGRAAAHWIGAWFRHPDGADSELGRSGWYLVRHADGRYALRRVPELPPASKSPWGLRGVRSIVPSPFASERGRVLYLGGFDAAGGPHRDTAWIYRGEWPGSAVSASSAPQPNSSAAGWFQVAAELPQKGVQAAAVLDLNGDGRLDLALAADAEYHLLTDTRGAGENVPRFVGQAFPVQQPKTPNRRLDYDLIKGISTHDFNADGRLDLMWSTVVIGASTPRAAAQQVWLNRGDGTMNAADFGNNSLGSIRSVLFADFDGDGLMDSYHSVSPYAAAGSSPNQLRRGLPGGKFGPDMIAETIATPDFWQHKGFKGAVVRDLDGDGRPDLITGAVADVGPTVREPQAAWERGLFILQNVSTPGSIRFQDVSNESVARAHSDGTRHPQMHVYSPIPLDYDNDGRLDLFITGSRARFAHRSIEDNTPVLRLLRNVSTPGRIRFEDVTVAAGLDFMNDERFKKSFATDTPPNLAAGAALDVDNDGHVDVVHVNRRFGSAETPEACSLWHNDGQGHFKLVQGDINGVRRMARDLTVADFNDDGRLDLVLVDGSAGGGKHSDENFLYLNRAASTNHWIKLNVSLPQNPLGLESRVTVFKSGTQTILGHDEVRTDFCYRSRKYPTLHFGLGSETAVDVLVKASPGKEQIFTNLKANQSHTLRITQP